VRDASRLPVRRGVPGELRRPPFCEQARSMESCLLACVRLSPLTKVPRGASSVEGMYGPQPKPPDQGRVVGCGPSLLGQAARCARRPWRHGRQGTAKPWIRWRCHDHIHTHAHAPAFASISVIRGREQERFLGRPTSRLPCISPISGWNSGQLQGTIPYSEWEQVQSPANSPTIARRECRPRITPGPDGYERTEYDRIQRLPATE
jgi:hypothetical protein